MLIRLHRWQPKSNRYRTEPVNLGIDEQSAFLDVIFRQGEKINRDAGIDKRIMRTQHVDRVVFNSVAGEIDVYLSPIIVRKYERKATGITVTKKRLGTITCECHHIADSHATTKHQDADYTIYTVCLIPGCNCKEYREIHPIQIGNGIAIFDDPDLLPSD
jgi:hypothetical protein